MKRSIVTLGFGLVLAGAIGVRALASPIDDAAKSGDTAKLQQLIDSGAKVNQPRAEDNATPLHIAAFAGQKATVDMLIKAGADINAHTTAGYTPLHLAAIKGYIGIAGDLLDAGAEIDPVSSDGSTPLHFAAMTGNKEMTQHLLDAGADRTVRDLQGRTPYDVAMARGHEAVATLIRPDASTTPSIYRDGTADIEKRIQQMDAAIARYRASAAKEKPLDMGTSGSAGSPDTSAAGSASKSAATEPSVPSDLSTEELLKQAGDLIKNSSLSSTYAPKGIDAAVEKLMNEGRSKLDVPSTDTSDLGLDDSVSGTAAATGSDGTLASLGPGNYAVQLGAVRAEDKAQREWTRLTAAHPDLLMGLTSDVTKTVSGDDGALYRLRAGPLTKVHATSICEALVQSHERCLVVRR